MDGKTELRHTSIKSSASHEFSGFTALTQEVFGVGPEPPWPAIALFDGDRRCVAGLQRASLRMVCDGADVEVDAIRNVAVAPDWRGRGLLRLLMEDVFATGDAGKTTLLYAETPALYERFGFASLAQHAFEGPAPEPEGDQARSADEPPAPALVRHLVATRTALSQRCDLVEDRGLRLAKLVEAAPLRLEALDAIVVIEHEPDTLVLVDVVAAHIPSAAQILGALGEKPARLRTLFTPDLLGWSGDPAPDDTGLMARGPLPAAMRRPFMLPPTVEF